MASSSSSSAAAVVKKFDVFLSFRGDDTRSNFTSVLLGLLRDKSIHVFIDDDLKRGQEISPSLMKAIEESMISIIIFSERYASSRWCLEELLKIMECRKSFRQTVIPVFYKVEATHVRNQTGAFGDGFAKLVENSKDTVQSGRWRNALTAAANISGRPVFIHVSDFSLAKQVVKDVLKTLNFLSPSDSKGLVGTENKIAEISEILGNYSRTAIDVRGVGIWGMGGIGKTTIAEVIFNKIKHFFDGSYFARNVREQESHNGLHAMRQALLSSILKIPYSNISPDFTKPRLGLNKFLLVFDDISSFRQIETLIGDIKCLGSGSRVIITTRDKKVLAHYEGDVIQVYKMEELSSDEARNLFFWYAFRHTCPNIGYEKLSGEVVQYVKGIPLALKVLGALLFGESEDYWRCAIDRIKIIPNREIHEVLKVSYDGLCDNEKDIFLDIACFFKGENKEFVMQFWDACGFFPVSGVNSLINKCLITISDDSKITTHDLLQDMGRAIVREESFKDPGERSRLYFREDIYSVFEENTGTRAIEGICLDMCEGSELIDLTPDALSKMRRLRFFKLHNSYYGENNINKVNVPQGLDSISTQLKYICWDGFPLKSLPSNFHPKGLIALDMPHSNIEQLQIGCKLDKLKDINLSYSKQLKKIEDLSFVTNLERLILEGCTSLLEIPFCIQNLNNLVTLNLRNCQSLHSLPSGIHLKSVKILILSCCSKFKTFPNISCNIEELYLDETAIEELPSSLESIAKLVKLNLRNCTMLKSIPSTIFEMKFVEHLDLSGCPVLDGWSDNLGNLESLNEPKAGRLAESEKLSSLVYLGFLKELNLTNCCISELPDSLEQLLSLESLHLGKNRFKRLPTSFKHLSKLSYLDLGYCERLQSLPELPYTLEVICAHNCTSLEEASSSLSIFFPSTELRDTRFNFSNCFKLDQDAIKKNVKDAVQKNIWFGKKGDLICLKTSTSCICFPGKKVPEWFTHQQMGTTISIQEPEREYSLFFSYSFGFIVCVILEFQNYHNDGRGLVTGCDVRTGNNELVYRRTLKGWDYGKGPDYVDLDHIFMGYFFDKRILGPTTFQFYVENVNAESIASCRVKSCGVHRFHVETEIAEPSCTRLKTWEFGHYKESQLHNLKHLDLSYSTSMKKIPDLSPVQNLERLILEGCTSLCKIPSSLVLLQKLVVLNLKHCKNLRNFPSGLHLRSLKKLLLSFCSNLKMFPDISSNLRELYLDETAIEELPPSIENLSRLVILDLKRCSMLERLPSNFCKLKSLEHLDLSGCSKLDGLPDNLGNLKSLKVLKAESLVKSEIPPAFACLSLLIELNLTACCINYLPDSLGRLSSLERLLLGRNNCGSLPASIIRLSKLSYLDLGYCTRLQYLPRLPCCLQNIDAHCCTSLEASPSLSPLFNAGLLREVRVNFSNCFELHQDALKENVKEALQIRPPWRTGFNPRSSAACICYPGIEIPEWFMFQSTTSFINLELSEYMLPSLSGGVSFALCAIVEFRNYRNDGQGLVVFCDCLSGNKIDGEESSYGSLKGWDRGSGSDYVDSDHVFIGYDLRLQFPLPLPHKNSFFRFYDSNVRLQFYVENLNGERIASCNVKKCGVHLLHTEIQESSGSYLSVWKRKPVGVSSLERKKMKRDLPKD